MSANIDSAAEASTSELMSLIALIDVRRLADSAGGAQMLAPALTHDMVAIIGAAHRCR